MALALLLIKKGIDMKATKIIAKHKSTCPGCAQNIFPGSFTKVYNDKWFHTSCWDELWAKIAKEKDVKEVTRQFRNDVKQEEIADELRGLVLQMEVLSGRIRQIAIEMGASW